MSGSSGFNASCHRANDLSFTNRARDFFDEFQAGGDFVILKAYDFQVARK